MYLRIYRAANLKNFWGEWGVHRQKTEAAHLFCYPLREGSGFVNTLSTAEVNGFDVEGSGFYDPVRCGVFADWIQENAERLTAHFSEEDKTPALERLQNLCDWLRSGLRTQEV